MFRYLPVPVFGLNRRGRRASVFSFLVGVGAVPARTSPHSATTSRAALEVAVVPSLSATLIPLRLEPPRLLRWVREAQAGHRRLAGLLVATRLSVRTSRPTVVGVETGALEELEARVAERLRLVLLVPEAIQAGQPQVPRLRVLQHVAVLAQLNGRVKLVGLRFMVAVAEVERLIQPQQVQQGADRFTAVQAAAQEPGVRYRMLRRLAVLVEHSTIPRGAAVLVAQPVIRAPQVHRVPGRAKLAMEEAAADRTLQRQAASAVRVVLLAVLLVVVVRVSAQVELAAQAVAAK